MTTYLNGDCDVKRNAKCGEYSAWTAVEESSNNTSFVIQDIWKKKFFFDRLKSIVGLHSFSIDETEELLKNEKLGFFMSSTGIIRVNLNGRNLHCSSYLNIIIFFSCSDS